MTMPTSEASSESNEINAGWKEKIHSELRAHLDTVKNLDTKWIQTAVALAKQAKLKFLDFRKTLARVLQDKKICLDGYRNRLEQACYSAV